MVSFLIIVIFACQNKSPWLLVYFVGLSRTHQAGSVRVVKSILFKKSNRICFKANVIASMMFLMPNRYTEILDEETKCQK